MTTSRPEQVDSIDATDFMPAIGTEEPRWPIAFALVILSLAFGSRVIGILALLPTVRITTDDLYQVGLTVPLFVVPILFVFSDARRLLIRFRWPVLAAQGVLTWIPFAFFGSSWQVGIGGLLAGLILLCFSGWGPWLAAVCLLVGDIALRAAVTGLPFEPAWSGALWATIAFVDDTIIVFGIIRIVQLIGTLHEAGGRAGEIAAAAERLSAAESLDSAVYAGVDEVATKVATAERLYSCDVAQASAEIRMAGDLARHTNTRARELFADHRTLPRGVGGATLGESLLGARLAWGVLVVVLFGYAAAGINDTYLEHVSGLLIAVLAAGTVCFVALQLYHSWLAHQDRRRSIWPVTLVVQAAVAYAFFLPPISNYFTIAGFLAGSILLLVPGRVRLAGFVTVVATWSALHALVPVHGQSPADRSALLNLYLANALVLTGLLVFGLSRLVDTAHQLEVVRVALARTARTVERLRLARDVHDLLGLGLSALALKADLVEQLIKRDDPRAPAEIQLMTRICATTRADVRQVTARNRRPTLKHELDAAYEILFSAGIEVHITIPGQPLDARIDDVFVPVLRESVTNILRHSAASACSIEINTQDDRVRLAVANNGVAGENHRAARNGDQPETIPGRGLGLLNLRSRVQGAGGEMLTQQSTDHFQLVADIPRREPTDGDCAWDD